MSQNNLPRDYVHDKDRLDEIARLRLHEDRVDEILNAYSKQAAAEFNLPISMISVVLDEAQVTAGVHGLEGWIAESGGIPVEWSFCANSVESKKPFIVENAVDHKKTKYNPLVTMDGIRCYAGVPLRTSNGHIIGNFCVVGTEERSFSEDEINRLKEFAEKAVAQIEARLED